MWLARFTSRLDSRCGHISLDRSHRDSEPLGGLLNAGLIGSLPIKDFSWVGRERCQRRHDFHNLLSERQRRHGLHDRMTVGQPPGASAAKRADCMQPTVTMTTEEPSGYTLLHLSCEQAPCLLDTR